MNHEFEGRRNVGQVWSGLETDTQRLAFAAECKVIATDNRVLGSLHMKMHTGYDCTYVGYEKCKYIQWPCILSYMFL